MDQFEFLFELEFLFDPSLECEMLNDSEGSQALPMPAGASLEALTVSAHSCLKAQSSLKFKPAEKRLAGKLDAKDSWFAAGFLSLYLAVYLAAGFVGVAAIEWVWTKLFA